MSERWLDADGNEQPGTPPPGFVQHPDGRWSAPHISAPTPPPASPAPAAGAPTPPPVQPHPPAGAAAPTGPPMAAPVGGVDGPPPATTPSWNPNQVTGTPDDSGSSNKPLKILAGVVGAAVIALVGVVLVSQLGDDEDGDDLAAETTTSMAEVTTTEPTPETTEAETTTTTAADDEGRVSELDRSGGLDDVVSCARVADGDLELDVINSSSDISDYWVEVSLLENGTEVGTETVYVNELRPGERTVERAFTFEEAGTECVVTDVDRFDASHEPERLADLGPCEVTGVDFAGDVTATVTVAHDRDGTFDYSIGVALLDADGLRRGSGSASVAGVRPGETAPGEVFTTTDAEGIVSCEVSTVLTVDADESFFGEAGAEVLGDIGGCGEVDGDRISVEVTNSTDEVVDYWITYALFDGDRRVTDESVGVQHLGPGVTAIERTWTSAETFDRCEVVGAERTPVDLDESLFSFAPECRVTGADFFDDVEGEVDIVNSGDESDISAYVGFYDPTGVRVGTSVGFSDTLAAGASETVELFTVVPYDESLTCVVERVEVWSN